MTTQLNPNPNLPNLFLALIPCKEKINSLILLINNTREYTYCYTIEEDEKGNLRRIEKENNPIPIRKLILNIHNDKLTFLHGPSNCFEQVGADDNVVLHQIIDSLTSIANPSENHGCIYKETNKISLKVGKAMERGNRKELDDKEKPAVLILGAGRVCQPVAEALATAGSVSSRQLFNMCQEFDFEGQSDVQVIVASLYLKDAEEV